MDEPLTTAELEGYLDEALPVDAMVRIEQALRRDPTLTQQLAAIHARRDAGLHSLGDIWRRHRLSCPSREQLGSYLLGVLEDPWADYIAFHLNTAGCRLCQANVQDMRSQQTDETVVIDSRRRKYFESSADHLPRK